MTSCVFIILQCNNILDHNSLRGGGQDLVRANSTAMGAISRRNLKFLSLSLSYQQSINQQTNRRSKKNREREKKFFFVVFGCKRRRRKKLSPLN